MKGKEAWFLHQKGQQQQSRCPHQQGEKEGRQKKKKHHFPCTSSKLGCHQKWLPSLEKGLIPSPNPSQKLLPRSTRIMSLSRFHVSSISNQDGPSQCLHTCLLFYLYLCFYKGKCPNHTFTKACLHSPAVRFKSNMKLVY